MISKMVWLVCAVFLLHWPGGRCCSHSAPQSQSALPCPNCLSWIWLQHSIFCKCWTQGKRHPSETEYVYTGMLLRQLVWTGCHYFFISCLRAVSRFIHRNSIWHFVDACMHSSNCQNGLLNFTWKTDIDSSKIVKSSGHIAAESWEMSPSLLHPLLDDLRDSHNYIVMWSDLPTRSFVCVQIVN